MRQVIIGSLLTAIVATSAVAPADARHHGSRYRHTYGRCHRSDGTTGTLIGAGGGALLGSAVTSGGIAGPLVGAAAGGLLGRHIDRKKVICR